VCALELGSRVDLSTTQEYGWDKK